LALARALPSRRRKPATSPWPLEDVRDRRRWRSREILLGRTTFKNAAVGAQPEPKTFRSAQRRKLSCLSHTAGAGLRYGRGRCRHSGSAGRRGTGESRRLQE